MRTARDRTSGENLFVVGLLIAPSPQGLESPANPARFTEAGIEPSIGSVGDSYDNALAETINGL